MENEISIDDVLEIDDSKVDEETGASTTVSIKDYLTKQINQEDKKTIKIPEEIAVKFGMTLVELQKFIEKNRGELESSWILYRESLKIKFALTNPTVQKDMMNNYALGTDAKSFPPIGFYFGENKVLEKIADLIIQQTQLQMYEKILEAKSVGIDIMSDEKRREFETKIEGFNFD